jgi:hypothetical protein
MSSEVATRRHNSLIREFRVNGNIEIAVQLSGPPPAHEGSAEPTMKGKYTVVI